ncbi:MAG: hypothetical protein ABUK01_01165 [Leptospirales bacterium]
MKKSLLINSIFGFLIQISIAAFLIFVLHFLKIEFIGRYLGPVGLLFILLSFLYSLRKRKIIHGGSMKNYLLFHEVMTWLGALLILVHSGIHFNAIIPWLATAAMLANITSGFAGRFHFEEASRELEVSKKVLMKKGLNDEDAENKLWGASLHAQVMEKWHAIHLPITSIFAGLLVFHVIVVLMYGAF